MQLSLEYIQTLIEEIERPENVERKRKSFKSYEVYEGALKKYVLEKIKEMYPKSWNLYTISDYSILKKIVDKKAKAYKEGVIRRLPDPDQSSEYQKIAKENALNEAMKDLDQLYCEHKYALMGCLMYLEDGEPKFNFMALEPHEFDVVKDDGGHAKIVIISYPTRSMMSIQDTDGMDTFIAGPKADSGIETKLYAIWTDSSFYAVEQDMRNDRSIGAPRIRPIPSNPDNVNPWGKLPFVYVPMNDGEDYPISSPLADQTIELNSLISVYLTSGNMQVGQLVLKYPSDQKLEQASSGMMTVLKLPQGDPNDKAASEADYISPSPNMDGHRTSIMTFASLILDEQGVRSAGGLDMNAEKFTSGIDRALSEADVQDIVTDNQGLYARVEDEIFEIVKAQLASVNRSQFGEDELQIIYRKPKILVTDSEVLDNLKKMEELGLLEPWEKFMVVDPNLSEQDAKDKLERINGVNNADQSRSSDQGNQSQPA